MAESQKMRIGYSLFWRFYFHNLAVIIFVVTISAAVVISIAGTPPKAHIAQHSLESMKNEVAGLSGNMENLKTRIDYWHSLIPLGIAIYSPEGELLYKVGEHTPKSLDKNDLLDHQNNDNEIEMIHYDFMIQYLAQVNKGPYKGSFIVIESPISDIPKRFFIIFATILVLLSLISLFAMKHLSKPLEHLISVSEELSRGNLAARTRFHGKGELKTLAKSLDTMAENLETRLKYEKELMANIAHEFRTPLARTKVALEICEDDDVTIEDIRMQLGGIAQDVDDLERLIQNIFSMSLLDLTLEVDPKKRLKMKKSGINIEAFLTEISAKFHERHFNNSLELEIQDNLKTASMDVQLITRTINNLLDNSAKYSDSDYVITLCVEEKGDFLFFSIKDRSPGLPDKDLPLLFDPFFRSERSNNRNATGGIGLGMALCKRIVEAHGGEITARHNPEGGLIVEFTLPY